MRMTILLLLLYHAIIGQEPYHDFIGAGHNRGIVVTSSDDLSKEDWSKSASGDKTLSGDGLEGKLAEASRFLRQATMGYNESDLHVVSQIGIEKWIDDQLLLDGASYESNTDSIHTLLNLYRLSQGVDSSELSYSPSGIHFRYGWWHKTVNQSDQLRQRMAYALSQIMVISDQTDLGGYGLGLASYYDVLANHAFGNYRDLLLKVALHPTMGYYLSHLNNPREIPEENIHPDQNFAREIMQLFSIGLVELNIDGTYKLDANGNQIPTYNNGDIEEMAKIFTGLGISEVYPEMGDLYFGRGIYGSDLTKPMMMYEEWHQQGPKHLINSIEIPDGQSGMKDIEDAIDMLFNHSNTGPFICKQLIQRLVTSNPSPAYVTRVSNVFNDDGAGVRGNLKAVLRAILLDDEARSCDFTSEPYYGKMVEPILRYTQFIKANGTKSGQHIFLNHAYNFNDKLSQHPLSSPSVFNFYLPNHSPSGVINEAGLVAPEFQILNSQTVLYYPNFVFEWLYYEYINDQWEDDDFYSYPNMLKYLEPALDDEALVNKIDLLYANGNLSGEVKSIIFEAIKDIPDSIDGLREKVYMALYIALISPDYLIQK